MNAEKYYGKKIVEISQGSDHLNIHFEDGTKIQILDDGQACCENRYFKSDDKQQEIIGQKLVGITVKDAPTMFDEDGESHEVQFLEIQCDKSSITIAAHNEHNGYYGGFNIIINEI